MKTRLVSSVLLLAVLVLPLLTSGCQCNSGSSGNTCAATQPPDGKDMGGRR